jgi:hypothetical protein
MTPVVGIDQAGEWLSSKIYDQEVEDLSLPGASYTSDMTYPVLESM